VWLSLHLLAEGTEKGSREKLIEGGERRGSVHIIEKRVAPRRGIAT